MLWRAVARPTLLDHWASFSTEREYSRPRKPMPISLKPIIRVKNLHKQFGPLEVLRGIDLEIVEGEVLVVIGPSGSARARCYVV